MSRKKIFYSTLFLVLLMAPCFVLAQTTAKLTNPLGTTDLPSLIGRIIKAALGVVGSVALIMFIYGGFMWLTSGGSPEKVTKGKNIITWAVIGLIIIFLSYTMVNFVIQGITKGGTGATSAEQPAAPELGKCVCTGGNGKTSYGVTPDECLASAPEFKPCSWSPL